MVGWITYRSLTALVTADAIQASRLNYTTDRKIVVTKVSAMRLGLFLVK